MKVPVVRISFEEMSESMIGDELAVFEVRTQDAKRSQKFTLLEPTMGQMVRAFKRAVHTLEIVDDETAFLVGADHFDPARVQAERELEETVERMESWSKNSLKAAVKDDDQAFDWSEEAVKEAEQ